MPSTSEMVNLFTRICGDDSVAVVAAKRELWKTVRQAGSPAASVRRAAVVQQLIALLAVEAPASARRELLWMLSELGGDESVDPIAALMTDKQLREDARMVLERIPGDKSLEALKQGLAVAPGDFQINLVQSLRSRGVMVPGHPCRKLVPTRQTAVKAI